MVSTLSGLDKICVLHSTLPSRITQQPAPFPTHTQPDPRNSRSAPDPPTSVSSVHPPLVVRR